MGVDARLATEGAGGVLLVLSRPEASLQVSPKEKKPNSCYTEIGTEADMAINTAAVEIL